jgi:lipid-binding SYLF domain-containing protein
MNKRSFILATVIPFLLVAAGCTSINPHDGSAQRRGIDNDIDSALTTLFERSPGSREMVDRAKGVLIFPSIGEAGTRISSTYGEGALRKARQPGSIAYYSSRTAPVGPIVGRQTEAVFVLFMTDEALEKFQSSNGWTPGPDTSVALMSSGAHGSVQTLPARAPIAGAVFSRTGVMVDQSTRVRKLDL